MKEVALLARKAATGPAGGDAGNRSPRYWAFLSYSHKDSATADWLHGALEQYQVPRSLVGKRTANGIVPASFSPVFRDRHELAASGDLGHTIREALADSRCLIVLCSPDAAQSRWTNEEITAFKKLHPAGCVLAAIVAGEPFASEMPGREAEECFPPALRQKFDSRGRPTGKRAEPIAADLREHGDGKHLGLLKIVAGMLGVGLDDLIQRDQQRRQKRLTYIAAASLTGMVMTSGLAVFAFDKRDEARDQRREAEGLVGFMLGDLRQKLEPIGRLDTLDAVGSRALAYFEKQDKSELSDAALAQRSKALTLMGEIANTRGDLAGALARYREAMAGTGEALRREPDNAQRIYDHAQNVFWVGQIAFQRGDIAGAEASMREYKRLAGLLLAQDSTRPEWQLEGIYADNNLGAVLLKRGRYPEAIMVLRSSLDRREALLASRPGDADYRKAFSEALAWMSEALEKGGRLDEALAQRERQIEFLDRMAAQPGADMDYRRQLLVAHRVAGRLLATRGNIDAGVGHLRSSIAIGSELLRTEPANSVWATNAAWAHLELGELQLGIGRTEDAAALARTGCDMTDRLIQRDSSFAEWRAGLRPACLALATRVALATGSVAEAVTKSHALLQLTSREAKAGSAEARQDLALAYLLSGQALRANSQADAAGRNFRLAVTAWPKDAPQTPAMAARLSMIYQAAGMRREAEAMSDRLETLGYRHPAFLRERRLLRSI